MVNTTPYGVCYDLPDSPYAVRCGVWSFHFSTQRNARNFNDKVSGRREWLTDSLTRRFHYVVTADVLAIFQLYEQIEKRGFYALDTSTGKVYDNSNRPSFDLVAR